MTVSIDRKQALAERLKASMAGLHAKYPDCSELKNHCALMQLALRVAEEDTGGPLLRSGPVPKDPPVNPAEE